MSIEGKKQISLVINQELDCKIDEVLYLLKVSNTGLKGSEIWLDKTTLNRSSLMRAAMVAGLNVIEKECLNN